MNITANTSIRRLELAATIAKGETELPLRIIRMDGDTWIPGTGNYYRIVFSWKSTAIAAVNLSVETGSYTLTGTLSTNTQTLSDVWAASGYPAQLENIRANLRLMDADDNVIREIAECLFDMPCAATDGGDIVDVINFQDGEEAITAGATYLDVTFDNAFAAAPTSVTVAIELPTADADSLGALSIANKTTSGFRCIFTAAPPISGYKLNWYARA